MYRNAIYDNKTQSVKLFTWDENGKRIAVDASFNPYLYVESMQGEKTSIYGTKVKKKDFRTAYDRNKFVRDSGIKRLFENFQPEQQFLLDMFWKDNEKPEFSQFPLKTMFIDIETYAGLKDATTGNITYKKEFPDVDNPTHPVNAITCYDSISKTFTTFGTKPYTGDAKIKYVYCKTEPQLFIKFLDYLEKDYPDILSGWSSEFFDIPYIINRCIKLFGEDEVKRLSPLRNIYSREVQGKFGRDQKRYYISGVSCIDYLEIYRRFCLKLRESYKLDAIAELELGERKVDYGDMDLATLADTDWNTFIVYNVQDVALLVKLEEKLQYIALLRMFSYIGLTTLERAMGTISTIVGAIAIRARNRKEVLSTFVRKGEMGSVPGGYVAEPKRGFKSNVVSFDANSLYPNVMISLNLSPETKVGRVEQTQEGVRVYHVSGKEFNLTNEKFLAFLDSEEMAITKAGFLFSQKKVGILPEFLDYYYKERVKIQKVLDELEHKMVGLKKSDKEYKAMKFETERLHTIQLSQKILINAAYGMLANKHCPLGDEDIASSVTLTGQAVIKHAGAALQNYLKHTYNITDPQVLDEAWVAGDTDSLFFSLDCIRGIVPLMDGNKVSQKFYDALDGIVKHINDNTNLWAKTKLRSKDSRFVFKREAIADTAIFLQKKRYAIHLLDNKGIACDKFKYVGVDVVRSTMPNAIKPYAKKIIETLITTKSVAQTNKLLNETFDIFKTLPVEEIAFVMGVNGYDKYARQCKGLVFASKMPIHVKAAYTHNYILKELGGRHEDILSGDKIRYMYVKKPNKYGVDSIGFKYTYPQEFREIFEIDYEMMFEKILYNSIKRFYDGVNWRIRKPTDNVKTELDDLFGF